MIDLLTDLPSSLSCGVLRDWIKLVDLSRVDSAFCNRTKRGAFTDLLRSDEMVCEDRQVPGQDRVPLWNWILERDIKLFKVSNDVTYVDEERLTEYATKHLKFITHLDIQTDPGIFATHCRNLVSLTCGMSLGFYELSMVLRNNPKIHTLDLDNLIDEDTETFEGIKLPQLANLTLMFDSYSRSCFEAILSMAAHLLKLEVFDAGADAAGIGKLYPHLRSLAVNVCVARPEFDLVDFTSHCPHIVNLMLYEHYLITDDQLLGVLKNLRSLRTLILNNDDKQFSLTDRGIEYIAEHCADTLEIFTINLPDVETEDGFEEDSPITHKSLELVRARCRKLHTFHCIDRFFTDYSANRCATVLFVLRACTEELLADIAVQCPDVEFLEFRSGVYSCPVGSMRKLCKACPKLHSLDFSYFNPWPKAIVGKLLKHLPQLRVMHGTYNHQLMDLPI